MTLAAIFIAGILAAGAGAEDGDVLFQASTIDALLEGVYDGDVTFSELGEHGDFGIGTVNALDGEMIALDGQFYQIRTDGKVYPVEEEKKTPFAAVTFFGADRTEEIRDIGGIEELERVLDGMLPSRNIFYAIRIDGEFDYIKTRSVPRQERPYPPLADVVKEQTVFELRGVKGTIAGFWCPAYVKGIGVPEYHLHFIAADRSAGGHLLDCRVKEAVCGIDDTGRFYMALPGTVDFLKTDLSGERSGALKKVEK